MLEQAKQEFEARGLSINTANSKTELMEQFRTNQSQQGVTGKAEITVVNIQKVEEDQNKVQVKDYATNLQRIFIIDEAHRELQFSKKKNLHVQFLEIISTHTITISQFRMDTL